MIAPVDELTELPALGPLPRRVFLARAARERFVHIARVAAALARTPVELVPAYSFKTNPRVELVALAREVGFFAEVISADELRWAAQHGFGAARTVYNGPEPVPAREADPPLAFVFADSCAAFARDASLGVAALIGVRLRPSMIASRFGVTVEEEAALRAAIAALPAAAPIGISFHARRGDFKGATWRDVAADVLERAIRIERATGHRVAAFDVGGGWTPDEFDAVFADDMRWLLDRVVRELRWCTQVIFEPGQAAATPAEALLTSVLEVRERPGRREAIVDAAYSDWPLMHAYVHRLYVRRGAAWEPLARGGDRLGGRTCLEYDVIDGLRLPSDLAVGDVLLIADAGSYDHSMAFSFAAGRLSVP